MLRLRFPKILAIFGLLVLNGCPYTEGCGPLGIAPANEAADADETPGAFDARKNSGDAIFENHLSDEPIGARSAPFDFGSELTGGPTVSTLSCPELGMPSALGAPQLYVDSKAKGTEDGSKKAPFRSIDKAFAAAHSKANIWVAAGTYQENITIPNKDLAVFGGFKSGFEARTDACATIIEGKTSGFPVFNAKTDVHSFAIEGVTIRKGARGIAFGGDETKYPRLTVARSVLRENGDKTQAGGAIGTNGVSVRLFRSVFANNVASKGAAIAANGHATLTIEQNLFEKNLGYSDHGGGLYLSTTLSKISRNTFRGNATGVGLNGGWGGAVIVYKDGENPARGEFSSNVFTENTAGIGGAVFIDEGATASMSHDLLYRNRAYPENGFLRGAALYVDGTGLGPAGASSLTAEYLTVVNNVYDDKGVVGTQAYGGNVYVEGFSKATFKASIFWNNGENGFYVEDKNELAVENSVAPAQCATSSETGFVPANGSICKIGTTVYLPEAMAFVDESNDDYHGATIQNLGAYAFMK